MSQIQNRSSVIADAAAAFRDPILIPGALMAVGLYLAAGILPVPVKFLSLFSAVPLLYFYYRRGRSIGLTMSVTAYAMVGLFWVLLGSPITGFWFGEYFILAVVLGEGLSRRFPPALLVGTASAGILVFVLAILVFLGIGTGQSPITAGRNIVEFQLRAMVEAVEEYVGPPSGSPGEATVTVPETPNQETLPTWKEIAQGQVKPAISPDGEMAVRKMMAFTPGVMIVVTIMVAWANLMVGRSVLARRVSLPPPLDNFKTWRSPERMVFALIACGFGSFIVQGGLQVVAIAVALVVCLIYFLQGLSILAFWFDQKGVPLFMRLTAYALIGLQWFLLVPTVMAVGLFDLWFDFRKLKGAQQAG